MQLRFLAFLSMCLLFVSGLSARETDQLIDPSDAEVHEERTAPSGDAAAASLEAPFYAPFFDFTNLVDKGMSSMVKIEAQTGGFVTIYDRHEEDYNKGRSSGSGVVISSDGYVVTNY